MPKFSGLPNSHRKLYIPIILGFKVSIRGVTVLKSNKKGAELSLNVIIVAAIALIVLVILVLIFTGRIAIFRVGVEDCAAKGGSCVPSGQNCPENNVYLPGASCFVGGQKDTTNTKCCIPT